MTTEKIMVGRIVAKLRNTVPVCLMENGKEVKRYKNIEFPDEMKDLEASAFGFVIEMDDKITFQLCFDEGVLPEEFPANRKSITWAERAAAKAARPAEVNTADLAAAASDAIAAATGSEVTTELVGAVESDETPTPSAYTEVRFNVTGDRRKALVAAVAEITGCKPKYQGAPTFAYVVGDVRIDKSGTLTGKIGQSLIDALADRSFTVTEAA